MKRANERHADYHAYLLRVWREGTHTPWRASLQSTATERVYQFATLEALFAFLDVRMTDGERILSIEPDAAPEET